MAAASLAQMDTLILDGKFHEATEVFCQLAKEGHEFSDLARFAAARLSAPDKNRH